MLVILPPSETKRPGGSARPLALERLAFSELTPQRAMILEALVALSQDPERATRVLRLGATQRGEVAVNAALRTAPTMPAIDRYTGVLYDALDAASVPVAARRWVGRHVLIHSAPLGPVGALDRIPAYRLGAGVSLPGVAALTKIWAGPVSTALEQRHPSFVLDLRSEAYVALGPLPPGVSGAYVRVVTAASEGGTRALNHFNKHAKGALVRRLALESPRIGSLRDLLEWAEGSGVSLHAERPGVVRLVV